MRPALSALPALAVLLLGVAPVDAAPETPRFSETWRFVQPGLDVEAIVPRPDGGLLVVGEFEGPLTLAGGRALTPRGDDDIALLTLDGQGRVKAAHVLGGSGAEAVGDVALIDGRLLLALSTRGTLEVGQRTVTAPPGESAYLPGMAGVVVALAADGRPEAVLVEVAEASNLRLAPAPGGFVLGHDRDRVLDGPETSTVTRYAGAKQTWSRTFEGVDLMRLDVTRGALYVASGGRNRLDVRPLNPDTGADAGPPTTLPTPFSGDRGEILALLDGPKGLRIVGYSGRPPVRTAEGRTESHSIEPFALPVGGDAKARQQIVDAVAGVVAVGRLDGALATVIDVIHKGPRYGGVSPPHAGVWLTIGLGPAQTRTLLVGRGEGAPATGVGYISPSTGSLIGPKHITLLGRCDDRGDTGCVVRIGLR